MQVPITSHIERLKGYRTRDLELTGGELYHEAIHTPEEGKSMEPGKHSEKKTIGASPGQAYLY